MHETSSDLRPPVPTGRDTFLALDSLLGKAGCPGDGQEHSGTVLEELQEVRRMKDQRAEELVAQVVLE
jgi:hypothetical protein